MSKQWNTKLIKQYENDSGQALLTDEQTLVSFSQDFGHLIHSKPSAVCIPNSIDSLQSLIQFANKHKLPVTIRGKGLSQCGQSLAKAGGLIVSMQNFSHALQMDEKGIWVEANTSWASLLDVSLAQDKAPFVLPYNCNLSVAGVLSAGGVGASSFKYGAINADVAALEIIDGLGNINVLNENSSLFKACLSGQGQFGIITKACIQLRSVKKMAKSFFLVYEGQEQWFHDMAIIRNEVDYIEMFCSPSIQGAKLVGDKRVPIAQWLYGMHLTIEYDEIEPEISQLTRLIKPWKVINTQVESIASYFLRHNSRFKMMEALGQWNLSHPWYECFVPTSVLKQYLTTLLENLPIHYASLVHVVPMAKRGADFLMLPENESVCSVMILNPGVPEPLKESCFEAIKLLDQCFLPEGGKRYLSGFLGHNIDDEYWTTHFGTNYSQWSELKREYDPNGIFNSFLHHINSREF